MPKAAARARSSMQNYRPVVKSNPAVPGVTALQIFCTGLGQVSNQPPSGSPASILAETSTTPTVTVGGVAAKVLFSGLAPGYVGLYQVNAVAPADAPAGIAIPVVIFDEWGRVEQKCRIGFETDRCPGSNSSRRWPSNSRKRSKSESKLDEITASSRNR